MWRRKQKKHFPGKVFLLVIPLLLVLLFFAFSKSNFLNIKKIDIEAKNLTCGSGEQIKVSIGILGQNFFSINKQNIENNLKKKFICIKSAAISKYFPDKINLKIENRQAIAALALLRNEASVSATPSAQDIENYELIDDEGIIFGKAFSNLNLPQIYISNSKENIKPALLILDRIKTLGIQINSARINQDIFAVTSSMPVLEMFLRLNNNVDVQLASLQLILDKAKIDLNELEFIDLRFDKPVVRFAPKK